MGSIHTLTTYSIAGASALHKQHKTRPATKRSEAAGETSTKRYETRRAERTDERRQSAGPQVPPRTRDSTRDLLRSTCRRSLRSRLAAVPTLVDRVDSVSLGVGDLNGELLLDGHDDLDGVERVEAEVRGERRGGGELPLVLLLEGGSRGRRVGQGRRVRNGHDNESNCTARTDSRPVAADRRHRAAPPAVCRF